MRGRVLGLPLWLIVVVCAVPPVAYSLSRAAGVPVELILPTAVAMEAVFLTQTVQQALRRAEVRRHFGFGRWELHHALSQHYELGNRLLRRWRRPITARPDLESCPTCLYSVDAVSLGA